MSFCLWGCEILVVDLLTIHGLDDESFLVYPFSPCQSFFYIFWISFLFNLFHWEFLYAAFFSLLFGVYMILVCFFDNLIICRDLFNKIQVKLCPFHSLIMTISLFVSVQCSWPSIAGKRRTDTVFISFFNLVVSIYYDKITGFLFSLHLVLLLSSALFGLTRDSLNFLLSK